jgi:prepilin-type N-terminal cleavage/methylation domain-containing protein
MARLSTRLLAIAIPGYRLRRSAFTLVELLVVVLIITILATIVLGAMFNAGEAARAARTRAQVAKINDLLAPLWEGYRTRRVPVAIPNPNDRLQSAQLRLDGLRELMRLELPDRKSDVNDNPTYVSRPALSLAYKARATAASGWTQQYQGAECLYMILSFIQDGDSNGLEFFKQTEIGDIDKDGMPEILDGWGRPIEFLRWPAGFTSDVSNSALQKPPPPSSPVAGKEYASPDYFDPLASRGSPTTTPPTYYIFPLVYSAGADGKYDITSDFSTSVQYSSTTPKNNPYVASGALKIGTPQGSNGHLDNIHNHLIATGMN